MYYLIPIRKKMMSNSLNLRRELRAVFLEQRVVRIGHLVVGESFLPVTDCDVTSSSIDFVYLNFF